MQARLVFLVAAALLLASPASAADLSPNLSPGGIAASLPLALPDFEPKPELPRDMAPAEKPAQPPSCLVTESELPDNFLSLMQRLDAPVDSVPLGAPPRADDEPGLPQSRSPSANSRSQTQPSSTSQGGSITRSHESGVTVYRGRH